MIQKSMYATNNGNLSSAIHGRLAVNPATLNKQLHITRMASNASTLKNIIISS
jgi:hypothetical protein